MNTEAVKEDAVAPSVLNAGLGVILPPLTMSKALTIVMVKDQGDKEADAAIEAIKRGDTFFRVAPSELFFHQLRLRCALDPTLHEKISVLYLNAEHEYKTVGLNYEDELRWPVGFLDDAYTKEMEINSARYATPTVICTPEA